MIKILFLGCNHNQIPYLQELSKRNYRIIGVDLNSDAPGKSYCHSFYNIGYDDNDGLLQLGKKENFKSSDKVFTASAQFAYKGGAYFASCFKIPYPKEEVIDFCLDKVSYYKFFLKNDIPLPNTKFIKTKSELISEFNNESVSKWFWLKSDFSKNPNYVYRMNCLSQVQDDIFWGNDRYLKNFYILQEEYPGISLRLNIYGDRFNVIDFASSEYTKKYHEEIESFGVINKLKKLMEELRIQNWLIKFDIILNQEGYAVLDIGLDPPSRMKNKAINLGINFEKYYLDQYLDNKINYPRALD